jgi:hypothetical protein
MYHDLLTKTGDNADAPWVTGVGPGMWAFPYYDDFVVYYRIYETSDALWCHAWNAAQDFDVEEFEEAVPHGTTSSIYKLIYKQVSPELNKQVTAKLIETGLLRVGGNVLPPTRSSATNTRMALLPPTRGAVPPTRSRSSLLTPLTSCAPLLPCC